MSKLDELKKLLEEFNLEPTESPVTIDPVVKTPAPAIAEPEIEPTKEPVVTASQSQIPAMNQLSNFYTVDYSEVVFHLIHFREQLQILHWQTFSFAQHKAFGQAYDDVSALTDGIVEALMGLYGRFKLSFQRDIPLKDISGIQIETFLDEHEQFFSADIKSIIPPDDKNADVYNMIQEYTAAIKTLKYLLTLK